MLCLPNDIADKHAEPVVIPDCFTILALEVIPAIYDYPLTTHDNLK